jgi:uncharacterized membrane protein YkvA (DUF1232 family)
MIPAGDLDRRFLSTLSSRLVTLPYDLKVLYEAAADPDLDRKVREVAAGAIIHILGPNDAAGDTRSLGYVDDVILLRLTLQAIADTGGEGAGAFSARFSDEFATVTADLDTFRSSLGDLFTWLQGKVPTLSKQVYKGKRVKDYVDDEEAAQFLYDEGLEFRTNYDITEEHLADRLKRVQPIVEHLTKRRTEEARKIS